MDNELYFAEPFTRSQAFIDLLLLANHKPATFFIRGIEVRLQPGQLAWSQKNLAARWKWNFKTVRRYLSSLERLQMVETKTDNITTIISVRNWTLYQRNGEQRGDQNGEQKESKAETDNNVKNDKKEKNTSSSEDDVIVNNEFFQITRRQLARLRKAYPRITDFRSEIAQVTDLAHEMERAGQKVKSPIALLHTHLKHESSKKQKSNEGACQPRPRDVNGQAHQRGGGTKHISEAVVAVLQQLR